MVHARFDEDPKRRYLVVPNRAQAAFTIRRALERVTAMNERQAYTFDREMLISMLDWAMTG